MHIKFFWENVLEETACKTGYRLQNNIKVDELVVSSTDKTRPPKLNR